MYFIKLCIIGLEKQINNYNNIFIYQNSREKMRISMQVAKFFDFCHKYFFMEKTCAACNMPFIPQNTTILSKHLCPACVLKMPVIKQPICSLCGVRLPNSINNKCLQCLAKPPPWDDLKVFANYSGILQFLMVQYKFSAKFSLVPLLSDCLAQVCLSFPTCHMILPMPRHEKRLKTQGYNQVVELCRPIEKKHNIPLSLHNLKRTRFTAPQTTLSARQRKNNPRSSFAAKNVQGKNVLLIDDVMTTGATLYHASKTLRQAKVHKIYIALLAKVD